MVRPIVTGFALLLAVVGTLAAADLHGVVKFGGLPLPGASVTATQGAKTVAAIAGEDGAYSLPDLADGVWNVQVEMLCFAPLKQDVTVAAGAPASDWEVKLLPIDQIKAIATAAPPVVNLSVLAPAPTAPAPPAQKKGKPGKNANLAPTNTKSGFQRTDVNASAGAAPPSPPAPGPSEATPSSDVNSATDAFAINGSQNNGAASAFSQSQAFGNSRRGRGSLYNGGLGFNLGNSVLDARNYSLTGQDTSKPSQNHLQGTANFGGPLYIPHLIRANNAPTFYVGYQIVRNRNATTQTTLVPDANQRAGIFPGNTIPQSLISPQAVALLRFYPLPNFTSGKGYNYQTPIANSNDSDGINTRLSKTIGRFNSVFGTFAYQNTRATNNNLFGFRDTTGGSGLDAVANWQHRFNQRLFTTMKYQLTRSSNHVTPFFANRENVSGEAGITGNNQQPINWGPPSLSFLSGIAGLSDAQASNSRNQTAAVSNNSFWNRAPHNFTFGADFRRQQFNSLSQQNARGSFQFTGAAAGNDFAGFLLGVPDTSAIAFGNADKYFRASIYDAFITDDWRVSPSLTLNIGVRWEYNAPITELYGRLVNLDIARGFTAEAPVVANNPTGPLTGRKYPSSLIQPDKHAFEPRLGLAWRPISGSSMVVRGGYGVTYNTSVYQSLATQMAQQSPLSKSLSVQNTPANPLTLANGFNAAPGVTPNTFAIDPDFRIGYAQTWQLSVQRDLPAALIMTATYTGIKGTRAQQAFLPNTYPSGVSSPCPACPSGYIYYASNGNSTREAGSFQLRRRLHNGITATALYTYAKAIDDAALGGMGQGKTVIAQNWLNLSGERGRSNFDQRHLLSLQAQYSTGVGIRGGTLLSGWRGGLFKEWTIATQINIGSGLPLTPTIPSAVNGTGVTGPIRPDYTGASLYDAAPGYFLNPAAVRVPAPGQWGNAGRDSITGPGQFTLNGSLARTFRLRDRYTLDLIINSNNALNHVTFPSWNTVVNSPQFGLPVAANPMRAVNANLRVRF